MQDSQLTFETRQRLQGKQGLFGVNYTGLLQKKLPFDLIFSPSLTSFFFERLLRLFCNSTVCSILVLRLRSLVI